MIVQLIAKAELLNAQIFFYLFDIFAQHYILLIWIDVVAQNIAQVDDHPADVVLSAHDEHHVDVLQRIINKVGTYLRLQRGQFRVFSFQLRIVHLCDEPADVAHHVVELAAYVIGF